MPRCGVAPQWSELRKKSEILFPKTGNRTIRVLVQRKVELLVQVKENYASMSPGRGANECCHRLGKSGEAGRL
jgi:hypothetical protein